MAFPIQIIESRKLPDEENLWLKSLGRGLSAEQEAGEPDPAGTACPMTTRTLKGFFILAALILLVITLTVIGVWNGV
jgi:hypothetical protein